MTEFSGPLRVPREDRSELVLSLRSREMSLRAIATALGVDERTVRRDLDSAAAFAAGDGDAVDEPTTVKGLDGKRQPASRRKQFWRHPKQPEPQGNHVTVTREPAPQPEAPRPDPFLFWVVLREFRIQADALEGLADVLDHRPETGQLRQKEMIAALPALQRVVDRRPD